jgi:hypothetical protein
MATKKIKITDLIAAEIKATEEPPKPKLTNRIIFLLLDDSGSMHSCYNEAVRQLNTNLASIRVKAKETGQQTLVSLYLFGGLERAREIFRDKGIGVVGDIDNRFAAGGNTPLHDAVGISINDAMQSAGANDPDTSFLVICATDGGENGSRFYTRWQMEQKIADAQRTDRWTFAFLVPRGYKRITAQYGIPEGNITEWDNTERGAEVAMNATRASTEHFYAERSVGLKSTKSFYTTDLSNLKKSDLSKMDNLSGGFRGWKVDREVDVKTFVEYHGVKFVLGAGYYPVTKKELLRTGRNVLVRDKATKAIYGGAQARSLLGIPAGETQITPGNHGNYDIFFQSTSVNRKLVRGTELLWDKNKLVDDKETWDSAAAKAAADAKLAAQQTT